MVVYLDPDSLSMLTNLYRIQLSTIFDAIQIIDIALL